MSRTLPFVSLIVPCRNEERFISVCLDSILANDYPKEKVEIFVVDGMSDDRTREIVSQYVDKNTCIHLIDNPKKIIPSAMNIGIRSARGSVIMKIDSHASYQSDYISKCIRYLLEYDTDNVGGVIATIPRDDTLIGRSIVRALHHPFGVGNSKFRVGVKKPTWTDTVFSGCYRREVFDKVGLYDENIARSEDFALNSKLRNADGKILLVPEIVSHYFARSNLRSLFLHAFDNGVWVILPFRYTKRLHPAFRHLIPFFFVISLIFLVLLSIPFPKVLFVLLFLTATYVLANLLSSISITIKEQRLFYFFTMPLVYSTLHLGYGLGSFWGLGKLLLSFSKLPFIANRLKPRAASGIHSKL